ncbi:hypothetical protein [Campylobacter geochelonis]|nr:hypothetical protein [Campylobacter geochelonis]
MKLLAHLRLVGLFDFTALWLAMCIKSGIFSSQSKAKYSLYNIF